jgi:hypothetical protein
MAGMTAQAPVHHEEELFRLRAENTVLRVEIEELRRERQVWNQQHNSLLATMLNISACLRNGQTAQVGKVRFRIFRSGRTY